MPGSDRHAVTPSRGRRISWRPLLVVLSAVALALSGATGIAALSVGSAVDSSVVKIDDPFPSPALRPPEPAEKQAQNILLLGSDTRGSINGSLEGISGQRSDTMMVVHIPADGKGVTVMSILRDSWVDIPGYGTAKINAALSWGGVPLAVRTVEGLLNVRLDHVVMIDLAGFKAVTDAVGGVDIDNPQGFDSSQLPGRYFPAGPQHLNGTEALAFVRERYAFSDGDFQRVRNQQMVVNAILSAATRGGVLDDITKLNTAFDAMKPYVAVDGGVTAGYLAELAVELRGSEAPRFFTMPTAGTGTSDDGQSIVNVDWAALPALQKAFQGDNLDAYLREAAAG